MFNDFKQLCCVNDVKQWTEARTFGNATFEIKILKLEVTMGKFSAAETLYPYGRAQTCNCSHSSVMPTY